MNRTLVILTPGFPANESDSTCLPMHQQLVKAFGRIEKNLKIIILSFQYPYHNSPYSWSGCQVIPFNGQNRGGLYRINRRNKILGTLRAINTQSDITGILSFWYGECAAVGKKFAIKNKIPHYCWMLGQDVKLSNRWPRWTSLQENELVAISEASAGEFERNHGLRPAYIIPPGIEICAQNNGATDRTIDILGVGSLIPLKQYSIFVNIVAALKATIPGLRSSLVGKGPQRETLEAMAAKLQLNDCLTIHGELPYPNVLNLMQNTKILLHPSSSEGFSGVCMEALYAGAHVISFCRPMKSGIPNWHIVSSSEEMQRKAFELLQDTERKHPSILFGSIDLTAERFLKLFNNCS